MMAENWHNIVNVPYISMSKVNSEFLIYKYLHAESPIEVFFKRVFEKVNVLMKSIVTKQFTIINTTAKEDFTLLPSTICKDITYNTDLKRLYVFTFSDWGFVIRNNNNIVDDYKFTKEEAIEFIKMHVIPDPTIKKYTINKFSNYLKSHHSIDKENLSLKFIIESLDKDLDRYIGDHQLLDQFEITLPSRDNIDTYRDLSNYLTTLDLNQLYLNYLDANQNNQSSELNRPIYNFLMPILQAYEEAGEI